MKKIAFINLIFTILLLCSNFSFGQELQRYKCVGKKYGFKESSTNKVVVSCKYDDVNNFEEGFAAVQFNGKWGFIDKTGKEVIACKYDDVYDFKEGLAAVKFGKWGLVDNIGNEITPYKYDNVDWRGFFEGYIKVKLNDKYGFVDKTGKELFLGKYDHVNYFSEGFASVTFNGKYGFVDKTGNEVIPCKYDDVYDFKEGLAAVKFGKWGFIDKTDNLIIPFMYSNIDDGFSEGIVRVKNNGKRFYIDIANNSYSSENEAKTQFATKKLNGDYDQIFATINAATEINGKNKSEFETITEQLSNASSLEEKNNQLTKESEEKFIAEKFKDLKIKSDVDINIPNTSIKNDKTFAVIIANEDYQEYGISRVEFAKNDGEIFMEYCIKTLGLPELNVHYRSNATLNNMRAEIKWIKDLDEQFKNKADINIIFYYSGHGTSDELSKSAYLLPTDGFAEDVISAYKIDDLYKILGNLSAKSVTVFLDACYSGAGRDGSMLVSSKAVIIKAKQGVPSGNTIVFSSSQGNETSFPYKEKKHGLFTYFLLKKLQETKGEITLGELSKYIIDEVGQKSVIVNRKSQTPTVSYSATMADKWENMKLK